MEKEKKEEAGKSSSTSKSSPAKSLMVGVVSKAKDGLSLAGPTTVQAVKGVGAKAVGTVAKGAQPVEKALGTVAKGVKGGGEKALSMMDLGKKEEVQTMTASLLQQVNEDTPDEVEQAFLQELKLVVEIVAARELLIGDIFTSDPYVEVHLGSGKEIHQTKYISKTLNPIYTPELGSTFLIDMKATELSDADGLVFTIKDYDRVTRNDPLGSVEVSFPAISRGFNASARGLNAFADRKKGLLKEFVIEPPLGVKKEAGFLLVRFKMATKEDIQHFKNQRRLKSLFVPKNLFSNTTAEAVSEAWAHLKEEDESTRANDAVTTASSTDAGAPPELMGEELHLYIEILKCTGLKSVDKGGHSDPYVKAKMGRTTVHETKYIEKTLNPVFSEETNFAFALHCPATEFYGAHGLLFKVKDYAPIVKNQDLGSVQVPANALFNSNGEDMELQLEPSKDSPETDAGVLTIRCRPTKEDDRTGEKKKFLGVIPAPQMELPTIKPLAELLHMKKEQGLRHSEMEEPQPLFIQIVSCRNLLSADASGLSDPYVKLKLGGKDLHETKPAIQTLEPIYEPKHNPYYLLEANPAEVRHYGGLLLKVKDWDRVGQNEDLGEVLVDRDTLYGATGEKIELALSPPKGKAEEAGFITIRARHATEEDMELKKKSLYSVLHEAAAPKVDYGEPDLSLLIEIVSGWQLPIADLTSSDPYVNVSLGHRIVHKTKAIKRTRDPIYTIKHDSVCVLDVATKEIQDNDGITFTVKDYDLVGTHDTLGIVTVSAETILEASGKRLEFQLRNNGFDAGFLAIRCRPAQDYESEFLASLTSKANARDFMGLRASYIKAMSPFGAASAVKGMLTRNSKLEHGVKKYRVRPYPDPERKEATEFMPEKEIEAEALKNSRRWLDIGSGNIGKVYVEILGCDGLPNLDTDLGTGNKTDSFVSLVYEENIVKTDQIDDCLSPRWLPWMQRAFIFRMVHPSSNLHIAVFDYDPGFHNDHDICGRVSIDLANLLPDTEYVLRYKLYENSTLSAREPRGVIMVRLRMERKAEKEMIMTSLEMPPDFYVNVKTRKDWLLVRQTVGGRQNLEAYSTKTIGLYVEELLGYSAARFYLFDCLVALIFWRGQVRVGGVWLPVHSMVIFLSGIILAERPSLFPSFFFYGMGWALLASVYWRNSSINPWHKSKTFASLVTSVATGVAIDGPSNNIPAHYLEEEAKAEEKITKDRMAKVKRAEEERAKAQLKLEEEHQSEVAQFGDQTADANVDTATGGVSLDPLKLVLYPLQQYLAFTCQWLRFVKNVLSWEEPYLAFILTFVFFGTGFVLMFVPWVFLFRWASRLVAWLLLGPHMKLADIYWYSKYENMDEEEFAEKMRNDFAARMHAARGQASIARIRREEAIKLKAVKMALYGNYITKVPILRMERFTDVPLHSSAAQPYKPPALHLRAVPERVAGQHFVGTMIPKITDPDSADRDTPLKVEEREKEAKKKN